MGHAIKRLSFFRPESRFLQLECWFSYTAEQDKVDGGDRPQPGLHENSIRDFGMGFDTQKNGNRFFTGMRYLNAVDGKLIQKWQYVHSTEGVTDKEWAYGLEGDWCKKGVDHWWFGRRYPNGDHDGYKDVPDGHQKLIYNETDCKLNWQYMRLKVDTLNRHYVEIQCQDRIWDMRGVEIDAVDPYNRIDNLINPVFWVSTDANRRVFLYIDSVVVSQE